MPILLESQALAPCLPLLTSMLEHDTLPHALLFTGGSAALRQAAAVDLARALLCTGAGQPVPEEEGMFGGASLFGDAEPATPAQEQRPCGQCAHCRKSSENIHPDLQILEGGAGTKSFHIDAIRTLRQDAFVLPNEAACKAYVLLGAHTMTTEAQNALLKLLEEPPAHVCLILTSPAARLLLQTVLSRVTSLSLGEAQEEPADAEREEKLQSITGKLAAAMASGRSPWALLETTAPLEGDRDLLREALPELRRQLYALLLRDTDQAPRLLRLIDGVRDLEAAMERNANQNLLLTQLAALGL